MEPGGAIVDCLGVKVRVRVMKILMCKHAYANLCILCFSVDKRLYKATLSLFCHSKQKKIGVPPLESAVEQH